MLGLIRIFLLLFSGAVAAATGGAEVPSEVRPEKVRLITLAPHLTELVFAAGAADGLVGVVKYSDFPPAASQLPLVGDAFRVDYERIVQLAPDIVLTWESGTPNEIVRYLDGLGIRVVELDSRKLMDIPLQIEQLGEITHTETIAGAAAQELRSRIQSLREEYSNRPPVSVFLQISAKPWFTITDQHILNDAIEMCGGKNIFSDLDGVAPMVGFESVVAKNPAAIIVVTFDMADDWQSDWLGWGQMNAVRNQAIYRVDANLVSRAGPRMIKGAEQICMVLAEARKN